jgi:hypothetical protein
MCNLVEGCCFRGHIASIFSVEEKRFSKIYVTFYRLHGVTSQKTILFVVTAMRTLNLILRRYFLMVFLE